MTLGEYIASHPLEKLERLKIENLALMEQCVELRKENAKLKEDLRLVRNQRDCAMALLHVIKPSDNEKDEENEKECEESSSYNCECCWYYHRS